MVRNLYGTRKFVYSNKIYMARNLYGKFLYSNKIYMARNLYGKFVYSNKIYMVNF